MCNHKGICGLSGFFQLIGAAALAIAVILPMRIQFLLEDGIKDKLPITQEDIDTNSDQWKLWLSNSDPDAPAKYFSFYFFNVTNPAEVVGKPAIGAAAAVPGVAANVQEIGPFVFRGWYKNFDAEMVDSPAGKAIKYYTDSYLEFDADKSGGLTLATQIYSPNMVTAALWANANLQTAIMTATNPAYAPKSSYAAMVGFLGALPGGIGGSLSTGLQQAWGGGSLFGLAPIAASEGTPVQRMFWKRSIQELLFGKAVDPLLAVLHAQVPGTFTTTVYPGLGQVSSTMPEAARQTIARNTFGVTVQATGVPEIGTIKSLIRTSGKSLNTLSDGTTPLWDGDIEKSTVRGTDGTGFGPGVEKGSTREVYLSQVKRAVKVVNYGDEEIEVEGIKLLKFTLEENELACNNTYPPNKAFDQTMADGYAHIQKWLGVPAFMSKPHFLDADTPNGYLAVTGLNPNDEEHDTYIGVEPMTGVVMSARKRLQLSVTIQPVPDIDLLVDSTAGGYTMAPCKSNTAGALAVGVKCPLLSQVKKQIVPIAWFEEAGDIDASSASDFKAAIYGALKIQAIIFQAGLIGGLALFCCGWLGFTTAYFKKDGGASVQVSPAPK